MKKLRPSLLLGTALGLSPLAGCSSDEGGEGSPGAGTSGISGSVTVAGASGSSGSGAGGGSGSGAGGGTGTSGSSGASSTAGSGGAGTAGSGGSAGSAGSAGAAGSGGGTGMPSTEKFSFFVTSMASMLELAKARDPQMQEGFGGDLTYGETGPGAGLKGADKICAAVAEKSMPGNNKRWRAFLSVTKGEDGQPVNAIDRVGNGPWYDRTGRVMAMNKQGLTTTRPTGGDAAIANDLPNEFGVPNNQPDPNQPEVDNHDTLTGSNKQGELDSMNMAATCNDWTSKVGQVGKPMCGHSWPRGGSQSWINQHAAGGCEPGVHIEDGGGPQQGDYSVGAGGGYGGIYCFALDP